MDTEFILILEQDLLFLSCYVRDKLYYFYLNESEEIFLDYQVYHQISFRIRANIFFKIHDY